MSVRKNQYTITRDIFDIQDVVVDAPPSQVDNYKKDNRNYELTTITLDGARYHNTDDRGWVEDAPTEGGYVHPSTIERPVTLKAKATPDTDMRARRDDADVYTHVFRHGTEETTIHAKTMWPREYMPLGLPYGGISATDEALRFQQEFGTKTEAELLADLKMDADTLKALSTEKSNPLIHPFIKAGFQRYGFKYEHWTMRRLYYIKDDSHIARVVVWSLTFTDLTEFRNIWLYETNADIPPGWTRVSNDHFAIICASGDSDSVEFVSKRKPEHYQLVIAEHMSYRDIVINKKVSTVFHIYVWVDAGWNRLERSKWDDKVGHTSMWVDVGGNAKNAVHQIETWPLALSWFKSRTQRPFTLQAAGEGGDEIDVYTSTGPLKAARIAESWMIGTKKGTVTGDTAHTLAQNALLLLEDAEQADVYMGRDGTYNLHTPKTAFEPIDGIPSRIHVHYAREVAEATNWQDLATSRSYSMKGKYGHCWVISAVQLLQTTPLAALSSGIVQNALMRATEESKFTHANCYGFPPALNWYYTQYDVLRRNKQHQVKEADVNVAETGGKPFYLLLAFCRLTPLLAADITVVFTETARDQYSQHRLHRFGEAIGIGVHRDLGDGFDFDYDAIVKHDDVNTASRRGRVEAWQAEYTNRDKFIKFGKKHVKDLNLTRDFDAMEAQAYKNAFSENNYINRCAQLIDASRGPARWAFVSVGDFTPTPPFTNAQTLDLIMSTILLYEAAYAPTDDHPSVAFRAAPDVQNVRGTSVGYVVGGNIETGEHAVQFTRVGAHDVLFRNWGTTKLYSELVKMTDAQIGDYFEGSPQWVTTYLNVIVDYNADGVTELLELDLGELKKRVEDKLPHDEMDLLSETKASYVSVLSSIERWGPTGVRPLYNAVRQDDNDLVKSLLEGGADPADYVFGKSPLIAAIANRNIDIVGMLLNAKPAIVNLVKGHHRPIFQALEADNPDAVRLLVRHNAKTGIPLELALDEKGDTMMAAGAELIITEVTSDVSSAELLLDAHATRFSRIHVQGGQSRSTRRKQRVDWTHVFTHLWPELTHLTISNVAFAGMRTISKFCPNLANLTLDNAPHDWTEINATSDDAVNAEFEEVRMQLGGGKEPNGVIGPETKVAVLRMGAKSVVLPSVRRLVVKVIHIDMRGIENGCPNAEHVEIVGGKFDFARVRDFPQYWQTLQSLKITSDDSTAPWAFNPVRKGRVIAFDGIALKSNTAKGANWQVLKSNQSTATIDNKLDGQDQTRLLKEGGTDVLTSDFYDPSLVDAFVSPAGHRMDLRMYTTSHAQADIRRIPVFRTFALAVAHLNSKRGDISDQVDAIRAVGKQTSVFLNNLPIATSVEITLRDEDTHDDMVDLTYKGITGDNPWAMDMPKSLAEIIKQLEEKLKREYDMGIPASASYSLWDDSRHYYDTLPKDSTDSLYKHFSLTDRVVHIYVAGLTQPFADALQEERKKTKATKRSRDSSQGGPATKKSTIIIVDSDSDE